MQGTQVATLAWEDSTCHSANKGPYITTTEPRVETTEACAPTACALQQEKPPQWEAHALQLESSPCSLQLNKACMQQMTHHSQKIKINK